MPAYGLLLAVTCCYLLLCRSLTFRLLNQKLNILSRYVITHSEQPVHEVDQVSIKSEKLPKMLLWCQSHNQQSK